MHKRRGSKRMKHRPGKRMMHKHMRKGARTLKQGRRGHSSFLVGGTQL